MSRTGHLWALLASAAGTLACSPAEARRSPPGIEIRWAGGPTMLLSFGFVPHLGGVGASGPIGAVSMTSDHAISFARAVRPRAILPIHHSTFSLYREPIERFFAASTVERFRVHRLREGQSPELR